MSTQTHSTFYSIGTPPMLRLLALHVGGVLLGLLGLLGEVRVIKVSSAHIVCNIHAQAHSTFYTIGSPPMLRLLALDLLYHWPSTYANGC